MTRKNCWRCPVHAAIAPLVETTFKASDHPESYIMICRTNTEAAEFIRTVVYQGVEIAAGATQHDEYDPDGVFAFFPNDGMFSIKGNLDTIKACWEPHPFYFWEDFKPSGRHESDTTPEGTRCIIFDDKECYMEANLPDWVKELRVFIRCEHLKDKARKQAAHK